jgi:hypothetical protein
MRLIGAPSLRLDGDYGASPGGTSRRLQRAATAKPRGAEVGESDLLEWDGVNCDSSFNFNKADPNTSFQSRSNPREGR